MPTAAILQYLNLLGYATLHFRKRIDVLVVFPLATYSPNKLRQISKLFEYTFAVKKSGDHLFPQKCMMMSFFIMKRGGGVYVAAKI